MNLGRCVQERSVAGDALAPELDVLRRHLDADERAAMPERNHPRRAAATERVTRMAPGALHAEHARLNQPMVCGAFAYTKYGLRRRAAVAINQHV